MARTTYNRKMKAVGTVFPAYQHSEVSYEEFVKALDLIEQRGLDRLSKRIRGAFDFATEKLDEAFVAFIENDIPLPPSPDEIVRAIDKSILMQRCVRLAEALSRDDLPEVARQSFDLGVTAVTLAMRGEEAAIVRGREQIGYDEAREVSTKRNIQSSAINKAMAEAEEKFPGDRQKTSRLKHAARLLNVSVGTLRNRLKK